MSLTVIDLMKISDALGTNITELLEEEYDYFESGCTVAEKAHRFRVMKFDKEEYRRMREEAGKR